MHQWCPRYRDSTVASTFSSSSKYNGAIVYKNPFNIVSNFFFIIAFRVGRIGEETYPLPLK